VSHSNTNWLLILLLLIGLAVAGLWVFRMPLEDSQPVSESPVTPEKAATPESAAAGEWAPLYPVPPLDSRDLIDLPPLDDSDSYFELALAGLFGPRIGDVLVDSGLIDRFVASVDALSRKHIAENIRPVKRLPGPFLADPVSGDNVYVVHPDNDGRYEFLVAMLATADMELLIENYRNFYPLFQEAYVRLGYPNGYFNDRLIEVIDHLLATPEPETPILLVRPKVLYQFADLDLEALSSGQKLMLRLGGENSAEIKRVLVNLRSRLASFH